MNRACFFVLLIGLNCKGQFVFPVEPMITELNDTSYYELNHSKFYSYFKQKDDSVFIGFDPVVFNQFAAIEKKTKCGYLIVKYKRQILVKHEIREGEVSGIGILYHPNLFGKVHDTPYCQAMFECGKLNGITCFYDDEGVITEILHYNKGKYIGHLYHNKANTKKDLKRGNKRSHDPFASRVFKS